MPAATSTSRAHGASSTNNGKDCALVSARRNLYALCRPNPPKTLARNVQTSERRRTSMTDEEVKEFENANNQTHWNELCDKIKAKYGGYPANFYRLIVLSGLATRVQAKW